jgi:TetR/AcrR family transcriptional regulator, transcriptional repressor of bet genes
VELRVGIGAREERERGMAKVPAVEEVRREQILRAAFEVAAGTGIGGVTLRAVAAEAGLSHSLVLFYFGRKERLVSELLEWLIVNSSMFRLAEDGSRHLATRERLHALLQQELARACREPRRMRLYFEFWALGALRPAIRARMDEELDRYRAAFQAVIQELLAAQPAAFAGATASGLAALVVSWVHGCAVQAAPGTDHFDLEAYRGVVRAAVEHLTRPL